MVLASSEPTSGMKCIQHILLAFNVIFTFTGVILISVGCTINSIYSDYASFMETRLFSPSCLIIGIGVIVFVVAIFGCFGAFKLSVAAIMTFCALLCTVFALEVIVGLVAYFNENKIEDLLVDTLNQTMYDFETDDIAARTMDTLQDQLYCCGVNGPADWANVIESKYHYLIPSSCCAVYDNRDNCVAVKSVGCLTQLEFLLGQSSLLLTSTILMIALVQLLGIIFSCKLARQLRKQKTLRDQLKWEVKENVITGYCQPPEYSQTPDYSRLPPYNEVVSHYETNVVVEKQNS